jgi:nucleoside-diphosphate-sugar epimerase
MNFPEIIRNEEELDEILTRPSEALVKSVSNFSGTIAVLGIGGKTGTTVGLRLKRAIDESGSTATVIGVSRFTDETVRGNLENHGVETLSLDLLDDNAESRLPDAQKVVYLAGLKFGTTGNEPATWAMNSVPPAVICRRYRGVPVVAYSTGAVYDMVPLHSGGASEDMPLEPQGEYPNSAVARERLFQWASARYGTPVCLIRLFYANDLRYGVIRDIADSIAAGKPIDISNTALSLIWQGDAADQSLLAFRCATVPATALNVTGPETVSVVALARRLGQLLGSEPEFTGEPHPRTLIGNATLATGLFGYPEVPLDLMTRWTAEWVRGGGRSLQKPTHWEVRDGRY